jgi:hypothetical protein
MCTTSQHASYYASLGNTHTVVSPQPDPFASVFITCRGGGYDRGYGGSSYDSRGYGGGGGYDSRGYGGGYDSRGYGG